MMRNFCGAIGCFVSLMIMALLGTEEVAVQVVALVCAGGIMISYIIMDGMIGKEIAGSNVTVTVDKTGQTTDDAS